MINCSDFWGYCTELVDVALPSPSRSDKVHSATDASCADDAGLIASKVPASRSRTLSLRCCNIDLACYMNDKEYRSASRRDPFFLE